MVGKSNRATSSRAQCTERNDMSMSDKKTEDNRAAAQRFREKQRYLIEHYKKLALFNVQEVQKTQCEIVALHNTIQHLQNCIVHMQSSFDQLCGMLCSADLVSVKTGPASALARPETSPNNSRPNSQPASGQLVEGKQPLQPVRSIYAPPTTAAQMQSHLPPVTSVAPSMYAERYSGHYESLYEMSPGERYCPQAVSEYYSNGSTHSLHTLDPPSNEMSGMDDLYYSSDSRDSADRPDNFQLPDTQLTEEEAEAMITNASYLSLSDIKTPVPFTPKLDEASKLNLTHRFQFPSTSKL